MGEFIKIEQFQEDIKEQKFEKVYKAIVKMTLELVNKIAKKKKIPLTKKEKCEEEIFYVIMYSFETYSVSFEGVPALMKALLRWNTTSEEDFEQTKEQKINEYITIYNGIIKELKYYEKLEKEIQEKGYEKLKNEKIEKLIQLFKEMLKYKNKEYNENWNFREWIDNVDTYYHYYHELFMKTLEKINYGYISLDTEYYSYDSIEVDEVERIRDIISLYNCLADEEDGYKNYAYFYKDFELKEGQTYSDLYNLQTEKFVKLFKEMLDFQNVEYNKDDNYFEYLSNCVSEHYPYYRDILMHLDVMMWNPTETYITLLDSMEKIYDNLSKNYKNHEQNMKDYQKELEEGEMLDDAGFWDIP